MSFGRVLTNSFHMSGTSEVKGASALITASPKPLKLRTFNVSYLHLMSELICTGFETRRVSRLNYM